VTFREGVTPWLPFRRPQFREPLKNPQNQSRSKTETGTDGRPTTIALFGLRTDLRKKRTRRQRFLEEMEITVPWEAFLALIKPVYHKPSSKGGRPPIPLEVMLRIHLLQQWFTLSDPLMEEMLIDRRPASGASPESRRWMAGSQGPLVVCPSSAGAPLPAPVGCAGLAPVRWPRRSRTPLLQAI